MRILMVQPLAPHPATTGASKANLDLLRQLAARGHRCVLAGPRERASSAAARKIRSGGRGAQPETEAQNIDGVDLLTFPTTIALLRAVPDLIELHRPERLVVSEDSTFALLAAALNYLDNDKVAYLAHGPSVLPFGPFSYLPDESSPALLRRVPLVLTVSRWMAGYIFTHARCHAECIDLSVIEAPTTPPDDRRRQFVTLINVSVVKGWPVVRQLAELMPDVAFAALRGWATTDTDRSSVAEVPNVTFLEPVDSIDELYDRTRVLLVPSLSPEGFGLVAVEAMARGIPVLASDQGGLPEAMLGVDHVLPVVPISGFDRDSLDDRHNPVPIWSADTDHGLWCSALRRLVDDKDFYSSLAAASREAAMSFIGRSSVDRLESVLTAGRIACSGDGTGLGEPCA